MTAPSYVRLPVAPATYACFDPRMSQMRAAVTLSQGTMEVVDVGMPASPGPGEVLIAPEAVGICGSDFHYFTGDIGTIDDPSSLYPRIQGHEIAATIVELGDNAPAHLTTGMRVAVWPVNACGRCYPCSLGRGNACVEISLTGIHTDGALQQRLVLPATNVFPVGDQEPELAALIEPVSIAVRAMARGRVVAGEHVVILGAGPIGQALALAATDRGASVLLVDRLERRLAYGAAFGAELLQVGADEDLVAAAREWSGGDGPAVVFEATGVPALVQTGLEIVAAAGRVVVVGLSSERAPVRVGDLPFREIDLLGTSCCGADDFAAAVELVGRRRDAASALVTHEFTLEQAPEAIAYAMAHPAEVMKAVVRLDVS
jgi:2-desacetyl-2-hydroxyethyl bacteriochlorophyllide A dehydrogenase